MKSVFLCFLTAVGCHAAELSIVECDMQKNESGPWILHAQIGSTGAAPLDRDKVQMKICVFERTSRSTLEPTKRDISFQWMSLPLNWKNRSNERFEVLYPSPKPGSGSTYAGYSVAVYYDGVLQEGLYSRRSIHRKFPFPESLK